MLVARTAFTCLLLAAASGCRATVPDETPDDLAPAGDLTFVPVGIADLGPSDLGPDMFVCPTGTAEICDDHCDNDGNGLVDDDDPGCTPQVLVTYTALTGSPMGTPTLQRLLLTNPPQWRDVNPNPVPAGGMATFNKAFASTMFVVSDEGGNIESLLGMLPPVPLLTPTYTGRDVCIFNGELIVPEQRGAGLNASLLHRYSADGQTELKPAVTMTGVSSACASDGDKLYVAFYQVPTASQIEVFTKGDATTGPIDTGIANAINMPQSIVQSCCDRLIDLAWVKKDGSFIGLFAEGSDGTNILGDAKLSSQLMAQFGFDGGVGPAIDAGAPHGIGEFLP